LPQPLSNISAQEGSRSRGSCRERGRQDEKKRKRKKLRERQVADTTSDRQDIRVPYDVEAKCNATHHTPHTSSNIAACLTHSARVENDRRA
jgi:hypothetical protein